MAFTDDQIAEHMKAIEDSLWSRRRPPPHVRHKVREGQRFKDHTIELFFVRPAFQRPGEFMEHSFAKLQHMPRLGVWRIFWKRADNHWNRYQPHPEAESLAEALRVIDQDAYCCFFG